MVDCLTARPTEGVVMGGKNQCTGTMLVIRLYILYLTLDPSEGLTMYGKK